LSLSSPFVNPRIMEYPGLLNWKNSVRHSMASDPGRELFEVKLVQRQE
jgi:hypothetical protein